MIEIEVRAFITDDQYNRLAGFFSENAELVADDEQETHYLSGGKDLRLQKNKRHAKIWFKGGKIHDDHREEIEIFTDKDKFPLLERLFKELGYNTEIKWFRKRKEYMWGDVTACLDDTEGYGKIIELEKMVKESEKEGTLDYLKGRLSELGIPLTPKEDFNARYEHYKKNWKELAKQD